MHGFQYQKLVVKSEACIRIINNAQSERRGMRHQPCTTRQPIITHIRRKDTCAKQIHYWHQAASYAKSATWTSILSGWLEEPSSQSQQDISILRNDLCDALRCYLRLLRVVLAFVTLDIFVLLTISYRVRC
jgi:hypothetical protein